MLGLSQRAGCVGLVALQVVGSGDVDEQGGAAFQLGGRQAAGVGVLGAAQGLAAVAELGGHLDAVDREVGRAEQGVQAGVLAVAGGGCRPGAAEEFPRLGGLAQLRGGDRSGQQQRAVGRGLLRWRCGAGRQAVGGRGGYRDGLSAAGGGQVDVGDPEPGRTDEQRASRLPGGLTPGTLMTRCKQLEQRETGSAKTREDCTQVR